MTQGVLQNMLIIDVDVALIVSAKCSVETRSIMPLVCRVLGLVRNGVECGMQGVA